MLSWVPPGSVTRWQVLGVKLCLTKELQQVSWPSKTQVVSPRRVRYVLKYLVESGLELVFM